MKKMIVWESHNMISGGQKMTLLISDLMKDIADSIYLIPQKGALSVALDEREITYYLLGKQSMPAGVKGKRVIVHYVAMSLKAVWRGIRIIRKEKPDVIYAPGPATLPWSAICGWITHKPVVWHLHHVFLDGPTKKLLNVFSSWKSVKEIIAVSNCVGEQITNKKGKQKVQVVYNPVDYERYSDGNAEIIYEEYPYLRRTGDEKEIMLGHVALMQETKRQEIVIDVIHLLRKQGYEAKAILVGGTKNAEDERYLMRVREKVKQLNCNDYVTFLGFRNDVQNVLKCIDFLMIPSAFEGFPLVGLEGNAAGIPVICADEGGSLEYVRVSDAGAIFKFDDAKSAAETIVRCRMQYDELRKKGCDFSKKHSIDRYKQEIINLFEYTSGE